jgi:transcriptional regulator with XRE-family HTH domain
MEAAAAEMTERVLIPIRDRIRDLLTQLGQSQAWLAEKMGVERSTVTRILKGTRNPTPKTLQEMAPVRGVSLEQLVAGTDAEDRVQEAQNLVPRSALNDAIQKVIEYERKLNDMAARNRDIVEASNRDRDQARDARANQAELQRHLAFVTEERDQARREARHHEQDARRYREALGRAVADVAQLQGHVQELGTAMEAGNRTGKVTAILAGVAAVVSVANYIGNSDDDEDESGDEDYGD